MADELEAYFKDNPQKVGEWAMKGRMVKKASDSLYNYIQDLKVQIVKLADGENGDVNNIEHKDDLSRI